MRSPKLLSLLILLYALWNSRELLIAWREAPYEHLSSLLLAGWCFPIAYGLIFNPAFQWPFHPCILALAVIASFAGVVGNLNTLCYIGLAFSLANFLPSSPIIWMLLWMLGGISWMPAAGWIGSHYFPGFVFFFRLGLVAITTIPLTLSLYKNSRLKTDTHSDANLPGG